MKRAVLEKLSKIDHLGVSHQESPKLSTTKKYCRAISSMDSDAEFHAESESAFKTARQYLVMADNVGNSGWYTQK